ncbi:MAG TPA: hypothetical protein VFM29_06305, partial [Vicinamibacteria bacterium]|nr:hypothetical protein [Vicinamibacteria bacterium]
MEAARPGLWATVLALAALALVQLVSVPATNFAGMDEWMVLELTGRGVVSSPYAFRPLGLVTALPAAPLVPTFGFAPYRWLFGAYLVLSAGLVSLLVLRLEPRG